MFNCLINLFFYDYNCIFITEIDYVDRRLMLIVIHADQARTYDLHVSIPKTADLLVSGMKKKRAGIIYVDGPIPCMSSLITSIPQGPERSA